MTASVETDTDVQWLYSRIADLEDELASLTAMRPLRESWGYLRKGNAYARPVVPRPRVEPLDVASEDAPHG